MDATVRPPGGQRLVPLLAGLVVGLVILAGVGTVFLLQPRGFERQDPEGYATCTTLAEAYRLRDPSLRNSQTMEMVRHAGASRSKAIRNSRTTLFGSLSNIDPVKLRAACLAQGMDIPVQ